MLELSRRVTAMVRGTMTIVDLRYALSDPFAVSMTFRALGYRTVTWLLDREMVNDGLIEPTGHGDVIVRPGEQGTTLVDLTSPNGHGVAHFVTDDLADFLLSTYDLAEPETESEFIDWAAELVLLGVSDGGSECAA